MKIGFTGTRKGMTEKQKIDMLAFLTNNDIDEVHHGACTGADEDFHGLVADNLPNVKVVLHPSNLALYQGNCRPTKFYEVRKPKDPIERNHDIVDEVDELFACPKSKNEELRSGTWATIRYAKKIKKSTYVIFP